MIENFIAAFIVYFVVIDPVGTAPIVIAITKHLNKRQKIRAALEGTFVAGAIMLFFCAVRNVDSALSEYFTYRILPRWQHHPTFGGTKRACQ